MFLTTEPTLQSHKDIFCNLGQQFSQISASDNNRAYSDVFPEVFYIFFMSDPSNSEWGKPGNIESFREKGP